MEKACVFLDDSLAGFLDSCAIACAMVEKGIIPCQTCEWITCTLNISDMNPVVLLGCPDTRVRLDVPMCTPRVFTTIYYNCYLPNPRHACLILRYFEHHSSR